MFEEPSAQPNDLRRLFELSAIAVWLIAAGLGVMLVG